MPFKSEAQKKKFAQMVAEGKMTQATYDKWDKETVADLPKKAIPTKPHSLLRMPRRTAK